jgi:hypothetical protein
MVTSGVRAERRRTSVDDLLGAEVEDWCARQVGEPAYDIGT